MNRINFCRFTGRAVALFLITSQLAPVTSQAEVTSSPSLLAAIDLTAHVTSLDEIQQQITEHARLPQSYLSLGESHLESESGHPLQKKFGSWYLSGSASSLPPVKFCSEKIESFLSSLEGQWLQNAVRETEIYSGNSPARTDFNRCRSPDYSKYITYSGFFHQHPFARPFPDEFPATSVITQAGNNIRDQMGPMPGFFISQIETPALELFETLRILKLPKLNSFIFENETRKIQAKLQSVRDTMPVLLPDQSLFLQKRGIFLSQLNFEQSALQVLPVKNAFLLITDLEYRKNRASFYFLNQLLTLPYTAQTSLLSLLSTENYYYSQFDLSPKADGTLFQMSLYRIPRTFSGESAALSFSLQDGGTFTLAMSADDAQLSCFLLVANSTTDARSVSCETLKNLAVD